MYDREYAINTANLVYLKLLKIPCWNFGLKIFTYICRSLFVINSLVFNKKKFKRLSKINNH